MGKSVRSKSEGILGAIKTVTNKPANAGGEVRSSTGPLPNVPKFQKLVGSTGESTSSAVTRSQATDSSSVTGPAKTKASTVSSGRVQASKEVTSGRDVKSRENDLPPRYQNPIEENNAKIEARKKNIAALTKKIEARTKNIEARAKKPEPQSEPQTAKLNKPNAAESDDQENSARLAAEPSSLVSGNDALVMLDSIDLEAKARNFITDKIGQQVSDNLADVDLVDICQPNLSVVGPAFNALKYSYHQPQIVKLYGNLISTAMSAKTARFAHPGFVDLIRNITEDEARVLSWFFKQKVLPVIDIKKVINKTQSEMRLNTLVSTIAQDAGCEYDDLAESYLANLERIGLLEIPRSVCLTDDSLYIRVLSLPAVRERIDALNSSSKDYFGEIVRYYAKLSVFGIRFCHACIR